MFEDDFNPRQYDVDVAIRVLGWVYQEDPEGLGTPAWVDAAGTFMRDAENWRPSESMADAWILAEALRLAVLPTSSGRWVCTRRAVIADDQGELSATELWLGDAAADETLAVADSAPLAITIAARRIGAGEA